MNPNDLKTKGLMTSLKQIISHFSLLLYVEAMCGLMVIAMSYFFIRNNMKLSTVLAAVLFLIAGSSSAQQNFDPAALFTLSGINNDRVNTCPGVETQVGVVVDNWSPGIQYVWNTGETDSVITVFPEVNSQYFVTVTHTNSGQQEILTLDVFVDYEPLKVKAQNDIFNEAECPNGPANIGVEVSGGKPGYWIEWEDGDNQATKIVVAGEDRVYPVKITDACAYDTIYSEASVDVFEHDDLSINNLNDKIVECFNRPITLSISEWNASGGLGDYKFSWDGWMTTNKSLTVTPADQSEFKVQMTDKCHADTVSAVVSVRQKDETTYAQGDISICAGETAEIVAGNIGQNGNFNFSWDGTHYSRPLEVSPEETTTYTLEFIDFCSMKQSVDVTVKVGNPKADFEFVFDDQSNNVTFDNKSTSDVVKYNWRFGDGTSSRLFEPNHEFKVQSNYVVTLIVEDESGCSDIKTDQLVMPSIIHAPEAFTPNADGINDVFKTYHTVQFKQFHIEIFDRWGSLIFVSDDPNFEWDGSSQSKGTPIGVYTYKINATTSNDREVNKFGHITVVAN